MNLKNSAYLSLLAILFLCVGAIALNSIKNMQKDRITENLQTVMGETSRTINLQLSQKLAEIAFVADGADVKEVLHTVLAEYQSEHKMQSKTVNNRLTTLFHPWLIRHNGIGFSVLAPDGTCLISDSSENVGALSLLAGNATTFQKIFAGESLAWLPEAKAYKIKKQKVAAASAHVPIFLVTPIFGENQKILGGLVVEVDPVTEFASVVRMARFGSTADFYMFDRSGTLISPVRFAQTLKEQRAIDSNESLVGKVRITLPDSGNTENAGNSKGKRAQLTYAVAEALVGRSGVDVNGYEDYRGVDVVGIWRWDAHQGIGMVYEIDLVEAYKSYYSICLTIIVSMSSLYLVIGAIFWVVDRKKEQLDQTNRSLHQSEQKLRTVLGALEDGLILVDENLSVLMWNRGAETLLGYTADEAMGRRIYDLIVPSRYRSQIVKQIPHFQQTGQVWRHNKENEFTVTHKSGQEFPAEMTLTPLSLDGSWHAVVIVHDIRPRKAREAIINQSEKRLKHAQKLAQIGYWEFDIGSGECRLSVEASNILGIKNKAETLPFSQFLEIILHDDRENFDRFRNSPTEEDIFSFEHRIVTTGKEESFFQQHCSVEKDEAKNPVLIRCAVQDITDSKEEAKRYRRLTERFKMATSAAEMGVWEWDIKEDSVYWDDQMFQLYGVSPEDFSYTSREWFNALHEDDRVATTHDLERSIAAGIQFDGIFRIRQSDGKVRYFRGVANTYLDRDGVPERMVGINYDLSETIEVRIELEKLNNELKSRVAERTSELEKSRKAALSIMQDAEIQKRRAEAALEELRESQEKLVQSEESYRGLVESIHDIIWEHDARGRISYISPTVKNVAGFEQEELVGSIGFALLPEEDRRQAVKMFKEAAREGRPVQNLEYRFRHKDGDKFVHLETNATPVYAADGTLLGFRGVSRDVTERRHQQEALRKLSRAIEASPITVLITDVNANIEYVNPNFTEVTGYTAEEVIGRNPRFLRSGKHSDEFYNDLWKKLLAGGQWHGELCNKRKDGSIVWEKTSISPIFNDKREITHFVEVKEDVSKKKEAEEELHNAVARAEEATRSKSDFLANMSHEIRTPMNAIIGMSHIVLQTELTAKQEEYIDVIHTSALMLLNLINDILDFSKIEAGKLGLEETAFTMANLLEGITKMFAAKLADAGVELIVNIDREVPTVLLGDPTRLGQIFSNLLSNAAKFTQDGEIEVNVRLLELKENDVLLECSVEDTGIGIDIKHIDKLFEKFSQADTSTTRKYGGTGLGLTICKQLLEMMGGGIQVESQIGTGSRFVFQVPLKYRQDRRKGRSIPLLPSTLGDLEVILIDQNSKKVESLSNQLESLKLSVKGWKSLQEAVSYIRLTLRTGENSKKLILLDYRTFLHAESDARKDILESSKECTLPVAFMVYMQEKAEVEKLSSSCTFAGTVEKPVNGSTLFNVIVESFGYHDCIIRKRQDPVLDQDNLAQLLEKKRILVAEDNLINQKVATELLEQIGVTPDIANDGAQAVDMCRQNRYDLVLMDIQMPTMDGIAAAQMIRKSSAKLKEMPIVAMTAHAMADDKKRSFDAGLNDHISKPINPSELYECLAHQVLTPEERRLLVSSANAKQLQKEHGPGSASQLYGSCLVRKIPGVDTTVGLGHLNGNTELYFNLLRDFYEENKDVEQRLSQLQSEGKEDEVMHIVHSLKGLAGTIGALELRKSLRNLEFARKEKTGDGEPGFAQSFDNLHQVLDGIKSLISWEKMMADGGDSSAGDSDKPIDWQAIDLLKKYLQAGDMESESVFLLLKPSLKSQIPDQTRALTSAMDALNHETALEIILQIEETLRGKNE